MNKKRSVFEGTAIQEEINSSMSSDEINDITDEIFENYQRLNSNFESNFIQNIQHGHLDFGFLDDHQDSTALQIPSAKKQLSIEEFKNLKKSK